jgi:ABC-type uncharacterized transport system ATPase subunit
MRLELARIAKRYGGREALAGVSLALAPGRIRALVGENGAGKSTLVKVACGLVAPDEGSLAVDGAPVAGWSAQRSTRAGLGVVHQHFTLVDTMTVAENVVLGREPRTGWLGLRLDRDAARARVRALSARYGLEVDPDRIAGELTVGERQRVELLRVLDGGARCVLLDEPTAVLSPAETAGLLEIVRALARGGASVLFISHKLDEVFAVADDVTVLRRGRVELDAPREGLSRDAVVRAVVGGELAPLDARPSTTRASEPPALRVEGLACEGVRGVSLAVRPGEVLGIAGVEGNGQRPLLEALAGLLPTREGTVALADRSVTTESALARRTLGLGYVPEDRLRDGLCADLSIAENLGLGDPALARGERALSQSALRERALDVIARHDIRPADPDAPVRTLSGGNAQKVLVARELERPLKVLLLAQPTRGVDLGAASAIHQRVLDARSRGLAVLLVSSELDELRALSDRVAVMYRGQLVAQMPVADASDEALGPLMIGASATPEGQART